jgi:predicted ATPase
VGATTHEHTAHAIQYEELPPVVAKGKAEPMLAWRATATLARRGIDLHAGDLSPLVGREVELSYLAAIFEKAAAQSTSQFVLIVGEPGIGKSRLVRELSDIVDARPQMTTWRQGFCPPFGENITYWALAEIVKGHAGIRDTDDGPQVEAKLNVVLPSGPDREWFRQRLRALLGLAAPEASREQNFASWLRFFEDLAASEPTVLVFEDLHWADEALLSDAAVIGSVFWDGALAAMGPREPRELEGMLSGLLQLHLIRRIRESSMDGECEFAFVHALARDVAYGQLPRAARARKHVAVAAWLEHQTGARAADLAEVPAYHLATAFALAEALQDEGLAAEIRESAVTWLRAAGDRAQSVDVATARRHYERALEIAPAGNAARPRLLLGLGEMLVLAGDYDAAAAVLEEAASHFTQQNDISGTVRSLLRLHIVLAASGRPQPELVAQALALARSRPPSPELVDALDSWAWDQYLRTGNAQVGLDAID